MKHLTKFVAAGTVATLLVPTLAFANTEARNTLSLRIEKGIERAEKKGSHDDRKEVKAEARATTTAAVYTKMASRIQSSVDTMLSFDARITALIAGADADEKAALQAKYDTFKAKAVSAKTEAGNAISVSAQVNANNSTTTNASLLAQAKTDLKESRGFFAEAKRALFSVLRALWN